ncbi:hypothetical protein NC651_001853 [Populus alba x Populus x berolinensis]|nr:hypothetical protein NC651_001853 [Populus alba x Populus x berolinensis]
MAERVEEKKWNSLDSKRQSERDGLRVYATGEWRLDCQGDLITGVCDLVVLIFVQIEHASTCLQRQLDSDFDSKKHIYMLLRN